MRDDKFRDKGDNFARRFELEAGEEIIYNVYQIITDYYRALEKISEIFHRDRSARQ